jgi:hypothetical protein
MLASSMPVARVLVALSCVVFFPSCIPPRSAGGIVRIDARPCEGAPPAKPAAIEATVRIECPKDPRAPGGEKVVTLTLQTDAAGSFRIEDTPSLPLSCEIVVEGPRLIARRFSLADHCLSDAPGTIWDSREGCHNVWLDASVPLAP